MKLKRILSVILACLFIIPLAACGSGSGSSDLESFDAFVEKYKRADYDAFLKDPSEFLKDFESVQTFKADSRGEITFLTEWKKLTGEYHDNDYEKEAVLFNKSVVLNATVYDNSTDEQQDFKVLYYILFDTGNSDMDFEIAKALTEGMISLYGDPEKIEVGLDKATESEMRKVFAGDPQTFSVKYNISGEFHAVSFFMSTSFSEVSLF